MSSTELTHLYSCSKYSKNPETCGDIFDEEVGKIYENLKSSGIPYQEDIAYQNGQLTKIDIWGKEDNDKLFIMIHGGYWLIGDRKKCLPIVHVAKKVGYTVVSVGYDYANEQHPLSQTIEELLNGVRFTLDKFKSAKKVVIGGHSVGAHLAFKAITEIHDPRICGAFLDAGIYQIQELVETDYGKDLGLTPEEAVKCSCDYNLLNTIKYPILQTNCGLESPKLYEQNVELSKLFPKIQYKEYSDEDHFTILTQLADENSAPHLDLYNFLYSL